MLWKQRARSAAVSCVEMKVEVEKSGDEMNETSRGLTSVAKESIYGEQWRRQAGNFFVRINSMKERAHETRSMKVTV